MAEETRLPNEVRLGAVCPVCHKVFEVYIDPNQPMTDSRDYYIPSCQLCKTHPVLNFVMTYPITRMKRVPELTVGGLILAAK